MRGVLYSVRSKDQKEGRRSKCECGTRSEIDRTMGSRGLKCGSSETYREETDRRRKDGSFEDVLWATFSQIMGEGRHCPKFPSLSKVGGSLVS